MIKNNPAFESTIGFINIFVELYTNNEAKGLNQSLFLLFPALRFAARNCLIIKSRLSSIHMDFLGGRYQNFYKALFQ